VVADVAAGRAGQGPLLLSIPCAVAGASPASPESLRGRRRAVVKKEKVCRFGHAAAGSTSGPAGPINLASFARLRHEAGSCSRASQPFRPASSSSPSLNGQPSKGTAGLLACRQVGALPGAMRHAHWKRIASLALGHSNPLTVGPPCAGVHDGGVPLVRLLCFAARGRYICICTHGHGHLLEATELQFVSAPSVHEHDASPQNRFLERWMLPLPRHSQPRDRQLRVAMDHNPNIFFSQFNLIFNFFSSKLNKN